jgi:hypothetical protein
MIRVPVTIDGDLKNQFVETNVGFDTTCKAYMFGLWQKKENYFVCSRIIAVAIAQYTLTSVVSFTCLLAFHHRFYCLSLFISRKLGCWLAYTAGWFICVCCFINFSSLKHGLSMWKVKHLSVLMRGTTICNSVFVGIAAIYQFSTMDMCMACVLTSTLMLSLQKR